MADQTPEIKSGQDMLPMLKQLENSGDADVSHAGAIGQYQIMPAVARAYNVDPADLFKPEINEQVATQLANDLWRQYKGNPQDMLVAWNAGTRRANRWIASGRTGFLPDETKNYVSRAEPMLKVGGQPLAPLPPSKATEPDDHLPGPVAPAPGQAMIQKAIDAGYSPDEVAQWKAQKTDEAVRAGYKPDEIDKFWGQQQASTAAIDPHIQANLAAVPPAQVQEVADNPLKSMAAGWGMSVVGLSSHGDIPKYVMPEHAGVVNTMLSGTAQMLGDLPASIAGLAFGAAGGAAAGAAVPGAGETGASEILGGVIGAGAGFMGLPQAMREIMLDSYNSGQAHSFPDFLGMAGKSLINTGKATLEGAISAPLGFGAAKVVTPIAGAAIGKGVDALTQAVTMTAVGGAMDGKVPDASNFAAAAVMALGFHIAASRVPSMPGQMPKLTGAGKIAQENMQHIYREMGIPPWKVMEYARTDPSVQNALLTRDVNGDPAINAMRKYAQEEPPPFTPPQPTTIHYDSVGLTISPNWMLEGPYTKEPVVRTLPSGQVVPDPGAVADYLQKFGELAGFKFNVGPAERIATDNPTQKTAAEQAKAPGPAYQSSPSFKQAQVYIPDTSLELNRRWYGLSTSEILFHEVGHALDQKLGFGSGRGGFTAFGDLTPAIRDEITRASQQFAPQLWKINPKYRSSQASELMADAIASWLSNPVARKAMPRFTAEYGDALQPYLDITNKTLPKKTGSGWERPPEPDAEQPGQGDKGGPPASPPPPPPPDDGVIPPEPGPRGPKIEGEDKTQLTTPELHEKMQEEMYGEKPKPESAFGIAKNWRNWVTELGPAKEIDKMLMGLGFDAKHQMGLQDLFRQTYASDARAASFITEGGFRMNGDRMIKTDAPSVMDAVRQVGEDGGNINDWKDYMVTRRAIDKEAKGFDTGHPLTPEERERLVSDGAPKYERATQTLQRAFDSVLEYGRGARIFSDAQVKAMQDENPIYISFRRIMGDYATQGAKGRTFKVRAPLKSFEGNDGRILDPLLASMDNIHQIVRMADRNRATEAVVSLAKDHLSLLGIKVLSKPEATATLAEPDSSIFKPYLAENTAAYEPFLAVRAMRGNPSPNRFMFLRDGVPEIWTAKSDALAKLIKGADTPNEANALVETASKFAEYQRAGIVGTPDFPVRNIIRDQITAFVLDPLHPPPFVTWLSGVKDVFTKSPIYQEWIRNGGAGSALVDLDKDYIARDFDKVSRSTGVSGAVWNAVTHPVEFAKIISERLDSASRVGYYKRAIKQGYDPFKAATMGRQAYIDYAERGTAQLAQQMARMIPFFRPTLLGFKQGWEAISERPMETLLYATAAVTVPKALLYAYNYFADMDLPEDRKYANQPRWLRDNYFVTPEINGMRFRMQMPQDLAVPFGGFPERALDHFLKEDPRAFDDWASNLINNSAPSLMPAMVKPGLEQWANKNFFTGKALVPADMEKASGFMQYTENTTEIAKKTALALHNIGVDWSPIIMENYVRGYTGTGGMVVLHALNAPFNGSNKPLDPSDYPFLGSFLVRNPGISAQPIEDFYKGRDEMLQLQRDKMLAMSRTKGGTGNEAELQSAVEAQLPLGGVNTITDRIHAMQSAIENIQQRPTITKAEYDKLPRAQQLSSEAMTVDEKRQFTDSMYSDMITAAKAGLEQIKAIKAK